MIYDVFLNRGQGQVIITRQDYGSQNVYGQVLVGSFELDVDERNNLVSKEDLSDFHSSDHMLIRAAKKVLVDGDIKNVDKLTFLDQASNAPSHGTGVPEEEVEYSEPGSDPDASNQKGGLVSTAGTTPEETAPDGVTPVRGPNVVEEGSEISAPDYHEVYADYDGNGDEPEETEAESESADEPEASEPDTDPSDETAADLVKRIPSINDKTELQTLYDNESNGKNRSTVIAAIEKRAAELEESDSEA